MEQKTKTVGIYTVSTWNTLAGVRSRVFHEQIEKLIKKPGKNTPLSEDDEIYNKWLDEWVSVAAHVQPKITLEEFAVIDPNLYVELITAIGEVNDELAEFATQPQSKKKKSSLPKKSMTA